MYSTHSPALARAATLAGAAGLALAMGVGRFALTPLLPAMQEEAGVSIAAGGRLAAANYIGYFIGALATFSLRIDALAAIRWSLVATAASTLAMALTASFPVWLASRGIAGIASAFLLVYVSAWALERVGSDPLHRASVFSGVGAGMFMVGTAVLVLHAWSVGATGSWIALGIGSCFLAALLWRAYEGPAAARSALSAASCPPQSPHSGLGSRRLANVPRCTWRPNDVPLVVSARRFVAAYAAAGFGYIIPATFLPAMARAASTDSALVDCAWPVLGLAACVSTLIAATVFPGACALRTWKWAQGLMAFGVGLPAFSQAVPALVVSGICVGGTFMVVTMAAMHAAREFGGREPRRLMALLTAAFAVGQIAGPVAVALLPGEGDFSRLLACAAAVLAAGVLALPNTAGGPINVAVRKET